MHELSLAQDILTCAQRAAREHGARRVLSVTLFAGCYCGVDRRSLSNCLAEIAEGTVLDQAMLKFAEESPGAWCKVCGRVKLAEGERRCPRCGGGIESLPETAFYIEELELDVPDTAN